MVLFTMINEGNSCTFDGSSLNRSCRPLIQSSYFAPWKQMRNKYRLPIWVTAMTKFPMMRFFPSLFIYFLFLFSLSPWDILCNILPLSSPEPHFRPGFLVSKCIEKDMVVCPRAVSGQLVIEPIDNSLGILSTNSKPSGFSPQTATIHSS